MEASIYYSKTYFKCYAFFQKKKIEKIFVFFKIINFFKEIADFELHLTSLKNELAGNENSNRHLLDEIGALNEDITSISLTAEKEATAATAAVSITATRSSQPVQKTINYRVVIDKNYKLFFSFFEKNKNFTFFIQVANTRKHDISKSINLVSLLVIHRF